MKTYYAKKDAESASQSGDTTQKLTLMRSSADSLKKSADASNASSLWEKKKITKTDDKNSNMLAKIGITIGKGNKLKLDEDTLKKADISSLKIVFTGYNSFASKISQKADSISNAAARIKAVTYTSSSYSDTLSKLVFSTVDEILYYRYKISERI